MKLLSLILLAMLGVQSPGGPAYLNPLQQRDSILIADQFEYGFELEKVDEGSAIAFPDFSEITGDTLALVRGWRLDTLKTNRKKGYSSIRGTVVLAPFEAGIYQLPDIPVLLSTKDGADTLVFDHCELDVKTMPVDTATFVIKDLKAQIEYPVTFAEVFPFILGALGLSALIMLAVFLVKKYKQRHLSVEENADPAYIVALRRLDKFRSDKYWAPDKQKTFYSGITDALKYYMEDRFGVDAPEMTTAELFDALKDSPDITPELFRETMALFETADFVKFAKHTVDDAENAGALPTAVNFITSTYKVEQTHEDVL